MGRRGAGGSVGRVVPLGPPGSGPPFCLAESDSRLSHDVMPLLYPLFVYLHLSLVQGSPKGTADSFYSRFHGMFLQNAGQKDVVEQLRSTQTVQDVLGNLQLRAFLDHKYVVRLHEDSYHYLARFLQSDNNAALCKVLALHIHLDVQPAKRTGYQLYAGGGAPRGEGGLEPADVPAPLLHSEAALEALQDSIRRVRDGPPSLTTICFYAFYNTEQQLNTAEVSADSKLLAAGFDNSCIKLWSLRAKKLAPAARAVDVSRIRLACDVLEDQVGLPCSVPAPPTRSGERSQPHGPWGAGTSESLTVWPGQVTPRPPQPPKARPCLSLGRRTPFLTPVMRCVSVRDDRCDWRTSRSLIKDRHRLMPRFVASASA